MKDTMLQIREQSLNPPAACELALSIDWLGNVLLLAAVSLFWGLILYLALIAAL